MNGPLIEVVIGLALIFFVFSLVVSGVFEGVAKVLAWRSKTLWAALRTMLEDNSPGGANPPDEPRALTRLKDAVPAGDRRPKVGTGITADTNSLVSRLYLHPAIGKYEQRTKNTPSRLDRIAPPAFARALLDELVPNAAGDSFAEWSTKLDQASIPAVLKQQMQTLLRDAQGDFTRLRISVEQWFDTQMSVLTSHYRRRARWFTAAFGLAVAVTFNVDTVAATQRLYRDDVTRAAIVAEATAVVASCETNEPPDRPECFDTARRDAVAGTHLPVGWDDADLDALTPIGWLVGAAAIALGAPFWFDVMKRATGLRKS